MERIDAIDWEILNATTDDWEDLEQIYLAVCFEVCPETAGPPTDVYQLKFRHVRRDVLLSEIADRLLRLHQAGLMEAHVDADQENSGQLWHRWFRMTPEGRRLWESTVPASVASAIKH